MEKAVLMVEEMSCGHCRKAIEGSVGQLAGVSDVKVQLETGKVEVLFNSAEVSLDKIRETIDDEGYDVN